MNITQKLEEAHDRHSVTDKILILSALLNDLKEDNLQARMGKSLELITNSTLLMEHIGDALGLLRKIKGNGGRMFGKVFNPDMALIAEKFLIDAHAELELAKDHAEVIHESLGEEI